jgi:superfamily II DNA or RNA helicase
MVRTDEHVFSFLTWWEHMPGRQKSEFCRKLLLDLSPKGIIDDKALHLIIHCARAVQKSTLSSAQEHELLQTLKNMIHRCPDYRWPQKTANEKGSHRPSPPRSKEITTLYGWQHEALQAWLDNGSMGIIKAVTGSGKTMVALMAIRRSLAEGGRAVILVPTCALLGQWKKVLKEQLQLGDEQIGCAGGGNRCHPSRQAVTIWVMNSARTSLAGALEHVPPSVPILLVVDECHRAGSKKNAHIFESRYDAAMGLSATPERVGDPGYEQVLLPALGRQV